MQEASLLGLIKVLFYIFLFYYVFKFLFRLFFPVLMQHTVKSFEEHLRQQQKQFQHQKPTGKTGETIIDKKPKSPEKNRATEGEYIDYEEIK